MFLQFRASFRRLAFSFKLSISDLWDTFDRARAESEFRSAIAWPLAALAIVLGFQLLWWLFLIAVPVILLVLAMGKSVEATSTLVRALELDLVKPPIFVRVEEEVLKLDGS